MSCYIRHLDEFFDALNLENNKENRKRLDLAIRKSLKMDEAHCPEVWARLKKVMGSKEETEELLVKINEALQN